MNQNRSRSPKTQTFSTSTPGLKAQHAGPRYEGPTAETKGAGMLRFRASNAPGLGQDSLCAILLDEDDTLSHKQSPIKGHTTNEREKPDFHM